MISKADLLSIEFYKRGEIRNIFHGIVAKNESAFVKKIINY